MMLRSSLGRSWIRASFAKEKPSRPRVQTVGFANDHIQNLKALAYKSKEHIPYREGKHLIFRSGPTISRTIKDYWLHLSASAALVYSLAFQVQSEFVPFPIAKHAYVAGLAIIAVLAAQRFLRNHSVVKEIYLLEGGKASQIVFQNQVKRRLFREPQSATYYNSLFAETADLSKWAERYSFPREASVCLKQQPFRYWQKHFSNSQNLLLIPTDFEVMDAELLVQVMQGKIIT